MQVVEEGEWKAIKVGKQGSTMSHLMFAKDLLLFGEATPRQMQCVMRCLNFLCEISREEVSHEKTRVLFSKNMSRNMKEQVLNMSGFKETMSLGKYLGVPLTGKAQKISDYQYIIDQ